MPAAPMPAPILELHGSWRAPTRAGEAAPAADGKPTCPQFLTREAKAEFGRQVKALERMGTLAAGDREPLAVYAEAWAEMVEMATVLREGVKEGSLKVGATDWKRIVEVKNAAALRVHALAQQFGFTPSSRTRIRMPPPDEPTGDPAEKYLRGAGEGVG